MTTLPRCRITPAVTLGQQDYRTERKLSVGPATFEGVFEESADLLESGLARIVIRTLCREGRGLLESVDRHSDIFQSDWCADTLR